MATVDTPEDPRRAPRTEAPEEAREESVRPVVALPRGGPSGLVFAFVAVAAGALLFSVLESRRRSAAEPSVRVRAADTAALPAAAPPLYIPPAPAPAPVTVVAEPSQAPEALPAPPRRRRLRKSSTCPRPPQWSSRSSRSCLLRPATPAGRPW
jgi:type IV secretion system protein VirB10